MEIAIERSFISPWIAKLVPDNGNFTAPRSLGQQYSSFRVGASREPDSAFRNQGTNRMRLHIKTQLTYALHQPTDLLLQIEVAELNDQRVASSDLETSKTEHFADVDSERSIGKRTWIRAHGEFWCRYSVKVDVRRSASNISEMNAVSTHLLPGDVVHYLMPSRFCPSDMFQSFVGAEFGHLQGGQRISAMCKWITASFLYAPGSSNAQTTALDTFVKRQGVCRDFAHVMVTLARASSIPARFVSVYAPDVDPQDFHAVAEVFLEGSWHLVDATGMAPAETIARIGVGADAADCAFLSAFGGISLLSQSVEVERC